MRKRRPVVEIPAGEAVFIVEALMMDGRIDSRTLDEYRARYSEEVRTLEARIAQLRSLAAPVVPAAVGAALVAAAPAARRAGRQAAKTAVRAAKKIAAAVSPERIKSRQLQGKYLGLMRQIPKNVVKAQFGREAIASKGKEAVIAEMESYLSGGGSKARAKKR